LVCGIATHNPYPQILHWHDPWISNAKPTFVYTGGMSNVWLPNIESKNMVV